MQVEDGNIRLQAAAGGGTLYDIGIYCINAARHLFGDEPIEVVAFAASNGEARFDEVRRDDERGAALPRRPPRQLHLQLRGGGHVRAIDLVGTKGALRLENRLQLRGGRSRSG